MSDVAQYGFRDRPYPLASGSMTQHWAGNEALRQRLLDVVNSPRRNDIGISEFVVLNGSYGAGKSHALRYLRDYMVERPDQYNARPVYVENIRVDDHIGFLPLYHEIVRLLGDDYIFEMSQKASRHVDNLATAEQLKPQYATVDATNEQLLDAVLEGFDRDLCDMLTLLRSIAAETKDGASARLKNGVGSDFRAAKSLGAFFRCLAACKDDEGKPLTDAGYLFLDQVEAAAEVKIPESRAFFNAILQLIEQLPENFCLIFSFTGDTALMEAIINESLWQRMTRAPIELPELDHEGAKEFLTRQFAACRTEGFSSPNAFHPFTEDAIDLLIDRALSPKTPGSVFRSLRKVLERSIKRDGLAPGEEIQKEDAERILGGVG